MMRVLKKQVKVYLSFIAYKKGLGEQAESILIKLGANEDDSGEYGMFTGVSTSNLRSMKSSLEDLLSSNSPQGVMLDLDGDEVEILKDILTAWERSYSTNSMERYYVNQILQRL